MSKIGIGITTHNRMELLATTIDNMFAHYPEDAKLVIVDDASRSPYLGSTFRFEENVGIATAKNKCLELLDDCDHIFLFDDDTYPVANDWWKPYVESDEPHLNYIFENFVDRKIGDCIGIYQDSKVKAYSHVRGCMIYVHRSVLDVVGGMDVRYGKAMNEHVDWSNRIFNAGLTSFRYADVSGSSKLFYSADEHRAIVSSITPSDRANGLKESASLLRNSKSSTYYAPYKKNDIGTNNIVLTSYFTNEVDIQRGEKWDADISKLMPLLSSIDRYEFDNDLSIYPRSVVLSDCFPSKHPSSGTIFESIEPAINPYFQRWLSQYQYLRNHPEIDNVFVVDATDVEMLKNPFPEMELGKLYVGDEPALLSNAWLLSHARHEPVRSFLVRNRQLPLLNCGVVGGSREMVMQFCHDVISVYFDGLKAAQVEMPIFNYLCYDKYKDQIVHGRQVTTVFKAFETESGAWFKHK